MSELDDVFGNVDESGPSPEAEVLKDESTVDDRKEKKGLSLFWKGAIVTAILLLTFLIFTRDGVEPNPQPDPAPDNGGEHAIIEGGSVEVVVVEESEERPRELSVIMRYKPWLESLESKGVAFDVIDQDLKGESAKYSPFIQAVEDAGTPVPALVIAVGGNVVVNQPFPDSKADEVINDLLKEKAGK